MYPLPGERAAECETCNEVLLDYNKPSFTCDTCGTEYDEDQEQCLVCGSEEVIPNDD